MYPLYEVIVIVLAHNCIASCSRSVTKSSARYTDVFNMNSLNKIVSCSHTRQHLIHFFIYVTIKRKMLTGKQLVSCCGCKSFCSHGCWNLDSYWDNNHKVGLRNAKIRFPSNLQMTSPPLHEQKLKMRLRRDVLRFL